jgi:hypothetical protein
MADGSGDNVRWIALILAAIAVLALISFATFHQGASAPDETTRQHQANTTAAPQVPGNAAESVAKPKLEDVTIHPYDLTRNPFLMKNHLVMLDPHSYPVLLDGNLLQYERYTGEPNILSRELVGLRFEKMLDEQTALFAVLGFNRAGIMSDRADEGMESIGELAVLVPSDSLQPDPQELWTVEPLGALHGTNGFGASVSVPLVRFDGYWRLQQLQRYRMRAPVPSDGSKPQ